LVTLDTSALIALLNPRDPDNLSMTAAVEPYLGVLVVPVAVLSEVSYFIERDLGGRRLALFVQDIIEGAIRLDCGERDWPRVLQLVMRYADLPLGLADAAVIACAERNGGLVATLDNRHFGAVAGEETIRIVS
jgi:predicted nucleic acid-binding protein